MVARQLRRAVPPQQGAQKNEPRSFPEQRQVIFQFHRIPPTPLARAGGPRCIIAHAHENQMKNEHFNMNSFHSSTGTPSASR